MARLDDLVDECLTVSTAFTDISSDTYNEVSAVNWEDNDKNFPMFLFDKRNVSVSHNSFSKGNNIPSNSTYTTNLYFLNTYTEAQKSSTTLQARQAALIAIADKYFAELKTRTESGSKGFYLGDISFNSIDEIHNERLIQLRYDVEFIVQAEDCTTGTFNY